MDTVRDKAHYYSKRSSQFHTGLYQLFMIHKSHGMAQDSWWMPIHAVYCIVRKKPWIWRIHSFLSKQKQACFLSSERHCLLQTQLWEMAWLRRVIRPYLLVHPIRMCNDAQDPRRIASPNNGFLCAINLNVNSKPFLT